MKINLDNKWIETGIVVAVLVIAAILSVTIRGCKIADAEADIQGLRDSVAANKAQIKYLSGRVDAYKLQADTLKAEMATRADKIIRIERRIEVPYVPQITNVDSARQYIIQELRKGMH